MATTDRLSDNIPSQGADVFYTEGFQATIEHHIRGLMASSGASTVVVEDGNAKFREGDFFGLCLDLNIPPQYHYIVMRCNGLYAPFDYRSKLVNIIVPSFDEINTLQAIYSSSAGIAIG